MTQEFLPLCDVLFNIISMASYFCDVVFDLIMVYTLYENEQFAWFGIALSCILVSLLASQLMSIKWYLRSFNSKERTTYKDCELGCVIVIHILQSGVLWRYFKLFIPVDLRYVKRAVRDLCLLRLMHAFCEAAPMLLIQMYFMWRTRSVGELAQVNVVSAVLSLFSVCWALASFNKHIRQHNLHKLVLTWLGVIYQLMWRLGTVSSRVVALTLYATLYHFWVFLVIGLHWVSMFLWLISPKNVFHGEKLSRTKKVIFSFMISYVYIFCYINLQEVNARQKMLAFYVTMFLENTLLMTVWLGQQSESPWFMYAAISLVWGGFALGMLFMLLYYKYFHVKRLKHHGIALDENSHLGSPGCTACQLGSCNEHSARTGADCHLYGGVPSMATEAFAGHRCHVNGKGHTLESRPYPNGLDGHQNGVGYIPGVFNCRLNPAFKRKKKKPTTFIPIPQISDLHGQAANGVPNGKAKMDSVPFWRKPLPRFSRGGIINDAPDANTHSRVDIQRKLQEKKRQQLQELRVIEEEIKQGKLQRPHPTDISEQSPLRQPIPRAKKQPWVPPSAETQMMAAAAAKCRSRTPEVILCPEHLEHTMVYYDYNEEKWRFAPSHQLQEGGVNEAGHRNDRNDVFYKSYRIPSDLDSQISLPRSYTLPREFRYHRKPKPRKTTRTEHFITSTNSSDGDVDSGDENELHGQPRPSAYGRTVHSAVVRSRPPCPSHSSTAAYNLHETKL